MYKILSGLSGAFIGFAISAFLSSDIVILDEVLSVADENFRIKCIEVAKQMGITAKEWNESKGVIILHLANEVCGLENKLNR